MNETPQLFCLLLIPLALIIWKHRHPSYNALPLPPGPRPLPVIGNLLDVPQSGDGIEEAYRDLNATYGDIVYLDAFGQPMVVLGTLQAAIDLLEKRSANYSDRQFSVMGPLTGWTWLFSVLPYGHQWRRTRRLFSEYMNSNGVIKFRPVQELHARRYLLRLLDSPEDFLHHGRHLFGSTIIRVGYGIDVDKSDVDYLGIAEEAMNKFNLTFLPGEFLVDSFPSMRHIPWFLPGGGFKRWAAKWYPTVSRMRDAPWDAAVNAARQGQCLPSMVTGLLERLSRLDDPVAIAEEEEYSKNAIASAYAGGADTTLSTLQSFYLAMATYPEIQRRAQAELDTVLGPHRLPTFADAPELPYISALVKECLRFRPVVPLSLVHRSLAEDEYGGYRIPAGTAVVSNPWAYARDPRIYPDPETFKPERFLKDGRLNPEIVDPRNIVFGFGRRVCPGRYFAEAAVFIAVSSVLHSFSISPPLDKTGKPVDLAATVKMTYGVISYPEPFECLIKPRSAEAAALIRMSCTDDQEA